MLEAVSNKIVILLPLNLDRNIIKWSVIIKRNVSVLNQLLSLLARDIVCVVLLSLYAFAWIRATWLNLNWNMSESIALIIEMFPRIIQLLNDYHPIVKILSLKFEFKNFNISYTNFSNEILSYLNIIYTIHYT